MKNTNCLINEEDVKIISREIRMGYQKALKEYLAAKKDIYKQANKTYRDVDLANELDISKSILCKWLKSKNGHNFTINTLVALALKGVPVFKQNISKKIEDYLEFRSGEENGNYKRTKSEFKTRFDNFSQNSKTDDFVSHGG